MAHDRTPTALNPPRFKQPPKLHSSDEAVKTVILSGMTSHSQQLDSDRPPVSERPDEDGDAIEDGSYVGRDGRSMSPNISGSAWFRSTDSSNHLLGVHEVLHQEEAAHLLQGPVDVGQTAVHVLAEGLRGDADILIYQGSAEREEEGAE
ncbi:hypothetical protein EYF80_032701 [Liparis tanakae]|uniref:Uncharacterized protein n=1 Tax=Liparis tanakae TaxID=230148 RepID=A0A4Z2GUB1_9TELE|nr:hypothetical protein EYF80_032701 [Liparis tanakae]